MKKITEETVKEEGFTLLSDRDQIKSYIKENIILDFAPYNNLPILRRLTNGNTLYVGGVEYYEEIDGMTADFKETITVSKFELKQFMQDVSGQQTGWSDSSYRLCEFLGIDPTDGI